MADMQDRTMTKTELISRRFEGRMMHRYGKNYLASIAPDGQFATVMVGNPEQKVIISGGDRVKLKGRNEDTVFFISNTGFYQMDGENIKRIDRMPRSLSNCSKWSSNA